MGRNLKLAAAGMFLVLSSYGAAADEVMSHSELRKLFPGSFYAVVHGIVTVQFTAKGNGTLVGLMPGKKDTGRWSLENGKLCIMMSKWTKGKSNCSAVVADNGWYVGKGVKFRKI
jgi:hypothetical protein